VNRSIYGPSQPRHTLVLQWIPATSAPTVQTAKRCHVWLFGRLEPLVETLAGRCERATRGGLGVGLPNWFAGPNQFIQCVRWPVTSFLTSWWTTAERQPHMRLGVCGSSRERTIRSPSPCRPLHHTPPPPPGMFRFLCRSQCHTLRARCSSTSLLAHPPNALSSVGAWVPFTASTLALDLSQASVYCTVLGSDISPRRHVDPHGVIHGEMLVCICE